MKLMYILPSEHFGGAEQQGVLQIRGLEAAGFEVVPVVGPGSLISDELVRVGVHDHRVIDDFPITEHSDRSVLEFLPHALSFIGSHRRSRRVLDALAEECDVEALYAVRTVGWVIAAAVARDLGVPYIIRAGSRPTRGLERRGIELLRWKYGAPSLVVANCEAVRAEIAPLFAAPSLIVPNIVDTRRFDADTAFARYRGVLGVSDDAPVIGLAARPAPGKGLELFLDVVERIAVDHPQARFAIAGDFASREQYEHEFHDHGMDGRVRFFGHLGDMQNFYASCDVVVLTSKQHSIEGSPNALLEAMAVSRPIVSTDVGGVGEIIDDGVEGFLVEDGDGAAFADRITELLHSPALRAQLGAAGRQRVLENNSERPVVAGLARAIELAADKDRVVAHELRDSVYPVPVGRA